MTDRVERFIAAARAAILWERVWPALWPATGIAGLFVAASLFDLFATLPTGLHALILTTSLAGCGYLAYLNLSLVRLPGWEDGARRVERDAALLHRPITESHDRIAAGAGDAYAEELWRAHIKSLLARIGGLRFSIPKSALQKRDPHALRFAVLLLMVAGIVVAGPDWGRRLKFALLPEENAGAAATLDAWINPPAYTGEAPVYLGRSAKAIAVPVGSQLTLRVHDAAGQPHLSIDSGDAPSFDGTNGEYGANYRIAAGGTVTVRASGRMLGHWRIKAIPDTPPQIRFSEAPSGTERQALKLSFTAADDYGVASVRAFIRPLNGSKLRAPLIVDLPLPSSSAKTIAQSSYQDLTANPYAGLDVEIVLEAKDGAGQTGRSAAMQVRLPARVFTNPLARALVEQRQNLALGDAVSRARVLRTLDALTVAPERFYDGQTSVYLALRSAFWGLTLVKDVPDIERVQDLLWQTALALEGGGLSLAAEELRRLQQMISQALAQGAPQEVIDALLQRYQDALNRYLQQLAQNPPPSTGPLSPNAKVLRPEDLQALLDAIQKLSQTGAREQAQQLMAMLQSLLENLHLSGAGGAGGTSPAGKSLSNAIQGLSDLMGKQRQLLDKTFRQRQGNPDPKDGGAKGLADQQGKLRDQLNQVLKGLEGQATPPQSLGRAGRQMGDAQGELGGRDLDRAGNSQQNALDALREGAGALANELMQRSGHGNSQDQGANDDPLGRAQGAQGPGSGSGVKVPDEDTLQRARAILMELRKRAAERGRPKQELDYIDRLLKQF
jgi:uncharacterized protein (TIGR02302 family)